MSASYTYDFADRESSLDVQVGPDPEQPLVTGSSYLPSGPLSALSLGNGATENRAYDGRYVPEAIVLEAPTPRRWDYTTDGVGNILEISGLIGCSEADLFLANQTVTGIETFTTCAGIEAGPAFSVETGGSTTFTAGTRIALGSGFSVKDGASFVAGIDPNQTPQVETKTYAYQDFQYFLTGGDGPWGSLAWTYDRIGNRLSETRDGATDTYAYVTNGSGGNTAILERLPLRCQAPGTTNSALPVTSSRSPRAPTKCFLPATRKAVLPSSSARSPWRPPTSCTTAGASSRARPIPRTELSPSPPTAPRGCSMR